MDKHFRPLEGKYPNNVIVEKLDADQNAEIIRVAKREYKEIYPTEKNVFYEERLWLCDKNVAENIDFTRLIDSLDNEYVDRSGELACLLLSRTLYTPPQLKYSRD